MMEEVGFEPTVGVCPTSVFETDAFGHSATLPEIVWAKRVPNCCLKRNALLYPLRFFKKIIFIKIFFDIIEKEREEAAHDTTTSSNTSLC
jgi:hypothetical protein